MSDMLQRKMRRIHLSSTITWIEFKNHKYNDLYKIHFDNISLINQEHRRLKDSST
jgi:hypothetical protein